MMRHDIVSQIEEIEDFIQYVNLTLILSEDKKIKVVREKRIGYYEWIVYNDTSPFMTVENNSFGHHYDISFCRYALSNEIYRKCTDIIEDDVLRKHKLESRNKYLDFSANNFEELRLIFHKVLPYLVY